jgi:hypothetical protein
MLATDITDDYEHDQDEYQELIDSVTQFKVSSEAGTESGLTAAEACELLCDIVRQQFWDWHDDASHPRRFKPRVRAYEVAEFSR